MKMKINIILKAIIIILLLFIYSCSNSEDPQPNEPPLAILSATSNDLKIIGTLTGSDSDGTISNKKVEIINSSDIVVETITTFSGNNFTSNNLTNGAYTVRGTVTDNDNTSNTDTASVIIDFTTPPVLDISITNGITGFDENTEGTEVVFIINNLNNVSNVTYSLNGDAQVFLEVDGNEVKRISGMSFDYETLQNLNVIITATKGSESDSENASIIINDVTEFKNDIAFDSPHGVKFFGVFDVADNDASNENLVEYELDKDGNSTGRTIAQMNTDLESNDGQTITNYSLIAAAMTATIKDNTGAQVLSFNSNGGLNNEGVFERIAFDDNGYAQNAENFDGVRHARGIKEIEKLLTTAGYAIPHSGAWYVGASTNPTEVETMYTLSNYLYGDQIARERDGDINTKNAYMVRKVINTVLSMTSAERTAMLNDYANQGYTTTEINN